MNVGDRVKVVKGHESGRSGVVNQVIPVMRTADGGDGGRRAQASNPRYYFVVEIEKDHAVVLAEDEVRSLP